MRLFVIFVSAVLITLGLVACGASEPAQPSPAPTSPPPTKAPATPTPLPAPEPTGIEVTLTNGDPGGPTKEYKFVPSEFTFKAGDTVNFTLVAESELHNVSIDALEIDMDVDGASEPGKQGKFTFTFKEAGEYRFYCLFHEANGMVGTIIVE